MRVGNHKRETASIPFKANDINKYFTHLKVTNVRSRTQLITDIINTEKPTYDEFYFDTVDYLTVKRAIFKFKSNACGSDYITIEMIKKIITVILPIIIHIVNHSLTTGTFPSQWKYAIIKPIPKKSSPKQMQDLRPISILPALSKVLEIIVHKQVTNHLQIHNLLNEYQSGFRHVHSTMTTLLKVTDYIKRSIDIGQITISALIDFSKAFDTVDLDILITKLQTYNFAPITRQWFCNYLYKRYQQVRTKQDTSKWLEVQQGVSQGSVLGPLLFCIYINDISSCLTQCKYHLYADDLQIYIAVRPLEINEAVHKINQELQHLTAWSSKHNLQINPDKTQCIIFGTQKQTKMINLEKLSQIHINAVPIKLLECVKSLGVYMDRNLTWNEHVSHICKKVYCSLHSLKRLKNFLPENLIKITSPIINITLL